ncbi:glycosyltransferase [Enterococcus sp. AZ103]|uniref:glycosyltransferase n=1 Tax=Enterococcus sp. AZ103 TaxID=2774628 RepID=UPI003F231E70
MNFFVNKAIGIGNSGVEHAQFYRAKCFDIENIPYKYVFTELVKNFHEAMAKWNIPDHKVINLWEMFVFGGNYIYNGAKKKYPHKTKIDVDFTNTHRVKKTITSSGMLVVEHIEKSPSKKNKDMLLVSEYQVEIYNYRTMERKIIFKYYHHPRRERLMQNIHIYDFEGENLFFRNEVMMHRFFFNYLAKKFKGTTNFFIDRGQETESALIHHKPEDSNLIELIHADHISDRDEPTAPLWNNFYEYALNRAALIERIVVSTELQREDMLIDFPNEEKRFVTIPVGGIRDFDKNNVTLIPIDARPTKFITASRLASEKHIDVLVRAMHKLHEEYPENILDIYGQGGEDVKIKKVIEELGAEDYVKLQGHSNNLEEIYEKYDAFLSASYSEGFGLTYIEALNAGLPIVTFNARFGAIELIKEGVNGFLKDYSRTDEQYSVDQMAEGIRQLMHANYSEMRRNTRKSVSDYQDSVIAHKWRELVDGL